MHPALSAQLLLILSGEGWVSGDDGVRRAVCQTRRALANGRHA